MFPTRKTIIKAEILIKIWISASSLAEFTSNKNSHLEVSEIYFIARIRSTSREILKEVCAHLRLEDNIANFILSS